jgi:predicted metal-dependent hydrolase
MIDWLLRPAKQPPTIALDGGEVPVVLRRTAAARRITMRLAPDGSEVRITLPRWGRTAEALDFARSRQDWLERQLAALPRPASLGDGAILPLAGQQLLLRHDPAKRRSPLVAGDELQVGGPVASLSPRLRRWFEGQARAVFAEDLADYCARAGRKAPPLLLSRAQRRWGSCAKDGTIRINWRLIMAPPEVRRSVVAHEVAHLVHFDHSPRFHALLGDLFEGDLDEASRWLKREGRGLYRHFG